MQCSSSAKERRRPPELTSIAPVSNSAGHQRSLTSSLLARRPIPRTPYPAKVKEVDRDLGRCTISRWWKKDEDKDKAELPKKPNRYWKWRNWRLLRGSPEGKENDAITPQRRGQAPQLWSADFWETSIKVGYAPDSPPHRATTADACTTRPAPKKPSGMPWLLPRRAASSDDKPPRTAVP
jgi:hypothetical protein